jgi:hypothetical protein
MAKTEELITLKLPQNDIGQIMDALRIQRDNWRYTQGFLDDGTVDPDKEVQECSDPEEAKWLADYYDEIIQKIKSQT